MGGFQLDIDKILEIDYFHEMNKHYVKNSAYSTLKHGLKRLYERVNKFDFKSQESPYIFLFVRSLERPSYNHLWEKVINSCSYSTLELQYSWANASFLTGGLKEINYPKIIRLIKTAWIVIKYLCYITQLRKQKSISDYISTYFRFLILAVEGEKILKIPFNHLVVFADMQRLDNLLVQKLKKKKTTITLQHGLYVEYVPNSNVNIVNYKNVVSDYFLAWGEETKALIEKYAQKCHVIVCGNPTINNRAYLPSPSFFTVVLDQPIFKDYNQKMLTVVFDYALNNGLKVNVQVHPIDSLEKYTINRDLVISENYQHSLFVVGHTSTMLFELMAMGVPTYKFKSEVPSNLINEKLIFETAEELSSLRSLDLDFKKESEYYLAYIGEASKKQYKHFFNSIEKSK